MGKDTQPKARSKAEEEEKHELLKISFNNSTLMSLLCNIAFHDSIWETNVSTVYIGHNAIGYSAKSDIVPILGWSRFPNSKNYRI